MHMQPGITLKRMATPTLHGDSPTLHPPCAPRFRWAQESGDPEIQATIASACRTQMALRLPLNFESWRNIVAQLDREFMAEVGWGS